MSTRATYTFTDGDETFNVFKHTDGNPEYGLRFISRALKLAWPLPRFEPDEFAAAFVAANKNRPGDVRILQGEDWKECSYGDIEYHYTIRPNGGLLDITIEEVSCINYEDSEWRVNERFSGALDTAIAVFGRVYV